MCPAPNLQIRDKFKYFYAPYNYQVNTKKHMSFDNNNALKRMQTT